MNEKSDAVLWEKEFPQLVIWIKAASGKNVYTTNLNKITQI
jgi:hypothetical protein